MNVNGVSNVYGSYAAYSTKSEVKSEKTETKNSGEVGASYESTIDKERDNKAIVAALKADSEARVNSFKKMVQDMLFKQGQKVTSADDIWKKLASGDFTVDRKTAEEARAAISEDGYWGVKQTSQRIFDMAVALSGGDEEKMDKMLEAFKKGFQQATKSWGKSLPDISNQTYDAVMEKFENYKSQEKDTSVTEQ